MSNVSTKFLVILLLEIILCLNIFSMRHLSVTYDENWHLRYGRKVLEFAPKPAPNINRMPFSALNAVPEKAGQLLRGNAASESSLSFFLKTWLAARLVTVIFSLLLAFFVYRWSKELYGPAAGLLSLFLYAFSPNMIAHSQLVTTDLYAACTITIAAYYFWKFMNVRNWRNAGLSATTLGVAQLAKYTALYLYPIFMLTALLSRLPHLCSLDQGSRLKALGQGAGSFLKHAAFFGLVSLILINIGFAGYRTWTPLKNYDFQSRLFQNIQTTGLKDWPVPVPYPYLQGLDMVKSIEASGAEYGNVYLLGELHTHINNKIKGFAGYYFYALLFKEPLATQALILLAVFFYLINRRKFAFFKNEIFLVVPVVFFLVYFNFFFSAQIGIRYILVLLPFLHILSGCSLIGWQQLGAKVKFGYAALCLYLVVSVLSYFPHYLSYFNEFVGDRTRAYKILADSNLDWGQSEWYLEEYRKTHPDAIVNPDAAVSGRIVVSVNELVGVADGPEKFRWLRDNFEPVGHIAYSYLVYDIPPESLKKITAGTAPKIHKNHP